MRERNILRFVSALLFMLLFFALAACGSSGLREQREHERTVTPTLVDDWRPFTQDPPGSDEWITQPMEQPDWYTGIEIGWSDLAMLRLSPVANNPELWQTYLDSRRIQSAIWDMIWGLFPTSIDHDGRAHTSSPVSHMHICSESALLHVRIVEWLADGEPEFMEFLAGFDGVIIEFVEFSQGELFDVEWQIREIMLEGQKYELFARSWIEPATNRVVVDLINYGEESKERFRREVLDSPMVEFRPLIVWDDNTQLFDWSSGASWNSPRHPRFTDVTVNIVASNESYVTIVVYNGSDFAIRINSHSVDMSVLYDTEFVRAHISANNTMPLPELH